MAKRFQSRNIFVSAFVGLGCDENLFISFYWQNAQKQNGAYNSGKQGKCIYTCNFSLYASGSKRKICLLAVGPHHPCERFPGGSAIRPLNGHLERRKWSVCPCRGSQTAMGKGS